MLRTVPATSPKAMLLSLERRIIVGAFIFVIVGAMLPRLIGLVQAVLPESKNMCKRTIGVLQELGRSCRLLGNSRLEYRVTNSWPRRRTRPSRSERNE